MDATVEKLLVLQRIDLEVAEIAAQNKFFPDRLAELREDSAQKAERLASVQNQISKLEMERRDLEGTLQMEEQRLKKSQARLKVIKTQYELQAMQREVDATRRANMELEEAILKKMEETEGLKKSVEELSAVSEAAKKELSEFEVEAQSKTQGLDELLKAKKQEAEIARKEIDPAVLSKYNFIRQRRPGSTIVEIVQGTCQGCFRAIPPQQVNELMQKGSWGVCPNCQRMVYVPPKTS